MRTERRKFRIIFQEDVLGSWPADKELFTKFVSSKAPYPWLDENDKDNIPDTAEAPGLTVFPKDDKGVHLLNYHIKGFLKEAGNALKSSLGIANLRSKIDNYVFVQPRRIYFHRMDGSLVPEADDILERPLRGETMKGPRTSLVASELIKAPVYLEFEIEIVPNGTYEEVVPAASSSVTAEGVTRGGKTRKVRKPVTEAAKSEVNWDVIREILSYGRLKGISQWRNGGWGSFIYEELEE